MDRADSDTGSVYNFRRVSRHLPQSTPSYSQGPGQSFSYAIQISIAPQDVTNDDDMDQSDQSNTPITPSTNQSPLGSSPPARPPRTPSPEELNMITSRAKRPEFAMYDRRLETFHTWPSDHHLKPEALARAGFIYDGTRDRTRCFYCGGALSRWAPGDDAWVEHSRHFQGCGYVMQSTGLSFRTAVKHLHSLDPRGTLTLNMVEEQLGERITCKNPLLSDPAVVTLLDCGYNEADVLQVAQQLKESGDSLTTVSVYNGLCQKGVSVPQRLLEQLGPAIAEHSDVAVLQKKLQGISDNNKTLRASRTCRICLDNARTCVFQPCGHWACCLDCAQGVTSCPVCRGDITSRVPCTLADG